MKKIALLAAAFLTVAATFTACSSNEGNNQNAATPANDAVESVTNIRWYDLDSVSANYKLVELLNSEAESTMTSYQSFARQ